MKNRKPLKEGLVDNILNHIQGILSKSNEKRYAASLERIAKSGPEGKKAVQRLHQYMQSSVNATKEVERLRKKYDGYYNS